MQYLRVSFLQLGAIASVKRGPGAVASILVHFDLQIYIEVRLQNIINGKSVYMHHHGYLASSLGDNNIVFTNEHELSLLILCMYLDFDTSGDNDWPE